MIEEGNIHTWALEGSQDRRQEEDREESISVISNHSFIFVWYFQIRTSKP